MVYSFTGVQIRKYAKQEDNSDVLLEFLTFLYRIILEENTNFLNLLRFNILFRNHWDLYVKVRKN